MTRLELFVIISYNVSTCVITIVLAYRHTLLKMKQFVWSLRGGLLCSIYLIVLEFGLTQEELRPFKDFKVFCKTEWGDMTPNQHRLMVQDCIVYFCQELNATELELHKISCPDYLKELLPDEFPETGRQIYRVLCRTCKQPSIADK